MTNQSAPSLNQHKSGWQEWVHQPHQLRLYNALSNIHFAIGVVMGIYIGFMSLTGAVLVFRDELSTWISVEPLVNLHSNLLAGRNGRLVNGVGAACLTLLCLTGAFIWWPGISNWRHGLVVSWKSNFDRIQWDLHSALGFWGFPFIMVWAISGTYFAFPELFNAVFPLDSIVLLWLADLHFGRFNWVTKTVWSAVGLVPAGLAFTGVFVCCRRVIFHKRSNPYLPDPAREQLEHSVPTVPAPGWPGFRPLRVARVDREAVNVVSLSVEQTDGASLPAPLPGQSLVLRLRTTPDGPLLLRNYSMSGAPGAKAYRVSVKRATNGVVSPYICDHLHADDILEVSAPRGGFILRSGDASVVLLSAGIGATPVLAMLHSLSSTASRREVWWIYGARNRAEHPFADESRGLLQTLVNSRSHIVYSKPDSADELGVDYDSVGHVDTPLLDRLTVPRDADFYLCGPPSFLKQLTQGLKTWGADSTRIHLELFGPEAPIKPGILKSSPPPVHAPEGEPGAGPQVSFMRSGLTVSWDSRFSSLLELAEACDVPVLWSCRNGVCHTCECALIGGNVSYQPDPLEAPADGNVLICCSRPSADVEVDL